MDKIAPIKLPRIKQKKKKARRLVSPERVDMQHINSVKNDTTTASTSASSSDTTSTISETPSNNYLEHRRKSSSYLSILRCVIRFVALLRARIKYRKNSFVWHRNGGDSNLIMADHFSKRLSMSSPMKTIIAHLPGRPKKLSMHAHAFSPLDAEILRRQEQSLKGTGITRKLAFGPWEDESKDYERQITLVKVLSVILAFSLAVFVFVIWQKERDLDEELYKKYGWISTTNGTTEPTTISPKFRTTTEYLSETTV